MSQAILDLVHTTWKSYLLQCTVELGIADLLILKDGLSASELAEKTCTRSDLLLRFLRAAASAGFISAAPAENSQTLIFRANDFTRTLVENQPGYYLVRHLLSPYTTTAWSQLADALKHENPAMTRLLGMSVWNYLESNPEQNTIFNGAMAALSPRADNPLARAVDFSQAACIVDLGGGTGTLLLTILNHNPQAHGIVFDRPEARSHAEVAFEQAGLAERCSFVAGNFFTDVLPKANRYLLKNVLHDFSDESCLLLLRNISHASDVGAQLIIGEVLLPEYPGEFLPEGLDIDMLLETGGKQRTAKEFQDLLEGAGFSSVCIHRAGQSPFSVIEAQVL
jgi:hypothetical protein